MDVYKLQRFGEKVDYKKSLKKIFGDFKYVPITERFGL